MKLLSILFNVSLIVAVIFADDTDRKEEKRASPESPLPPAGTNVDPKIKASTADSNLTPVPTSAPIVTAVPTTLASTAAPITAAPTSVQTTATTSASTTAPTSAPTTAPTSAPTTAPTSAPTTAPTSAPTTAPTLAPITSAPTSAPTPSPVPAEFYWNVSDNAGHNCILAKADIKLEFAYFNQTSNKKVVEVFTIPHNASNTGNCSDLSQTLNLVFNELNSISFVFSSKNATENYSLSRIQSNLTIGNGNETKTISVDSSGLNAFNTKRNTSYQCSWSEPATLQENDAGDNSTKATLRVVMSNIHFEAFRKSNDNNFSSVYSCSMDSPDIVPIMVGIALGILVIVVLIAYIVGRRNTQLQGYLSM